MDESKKWYESKGVIGGLVAVGAAIAGALNVDPSTIDQAAITNLIISVIGIVGGGVGIFGRIKATSKIESKKD